MIRILNVVTTGFSFDGGLSTVALNYYKYMSKDDFQIDFLSTNSIPDELDNYLKENNSQYFHIPNRKKFFIRYMAELTNILIKFKYDIIHIHGNSATMIFELIPAKIAKTKCKIVHCHSATSDYPVIHKLCYPIFSRLYDIAIAVSIESGKWLYKEHPFYILNNAIDLSHYKYDSKIRKSIREKYGLNNDFVIGTVGKCTTLKNQEYIIKIFAKYHKKNKKSKLLIVGDGVLRKKLESMVTDNGLKDSVVFIGLVDDVLPYYQAMDFFLFTSIFEGLGMVLIEAQATGLYCLSSDCIPKATAVSTTINYLSLNDDIDKWVESIPDNCKYNRNLVSKQNLEQITYNGYNIQYEYKKLEVIYKQQMNY